MKPMLRVTFLLPFVALSFLMLAFQNCTEVGRSSNPEGLTGTPEVTEAPPTGESSQATEKNFPAAGITSFDLEFENLPRHALVYTPSLSNTQHPLPVYLVLHGGHGNAEKARSNVDYLFEELAEAEKILIVYPEAVLDFGKEGGHWNDSRGISGYRSHDENVNDVGYLEELTRQLSSRFSGIDANQIFLVGASNGGMMVQKVACQHNGAFAGFVSVMAALPKNLAQDCSPKFLRPTLFINGTEDPLMKYDEEFVYSPNGQPDLGERLTVPDTIAYWAEKLNCQTASPQVHRLKDLDPKDLSIVEENDYPCSSDGRLRFLKVVGGGHTWPGGVGSNLLTGPVNKDIESPRAIWNFFNNLPTGESETNPSPEESPPLAAFKPCVHKNGITYRCATISYGSHSLQNYDLWLPNQPLNPGQTPLVVYIHGGGYYTGDKTSAYQASAGSGEYLEAGYAFATINYRLSGEFPFEKGVTGEHPAAMRDGASALQDLRWRASRNGYSQDKIALTGSSAGGGISLWLAFHDDLRHVSSENPRDRFSTRVPCLALSDTQPTLTIKEVGEILKIPNFVPDVGIAGLYGFTSEQYAADPKAYDERFAASMFEASPISHLTTDDNQIKILLTYLMDYDTKDIHSPEFGKHLILGEPQELLKKYERTSLKDLGNLAELKVNQQKLSNNKKNMFDFITNRCF